MAQSTKLEGFVKENKIHLEIVLKSGKIVVYIGKEGELNLYSFQGDSLNQTIDNAISDFMSRR